ncbi:MAG: DUF2851 family protein [Muribaculaceae bacterium]|nr:DUF2851 family protein [Muribaculaceae bacterium]
MENILSFVWRHNLLKGCKLTLLNGKSVEVITPGNDCSGNMIFSDAILRIEDNTMKMRVAISPASAEGCDLFVTDKDEKTEVETLLLDFLTEVENLRKKLLSKFEELPCEEYIKEMPSIFVTDLITSLAIERLSNKSDRINEWRELYNGDWEETCYVSLARSLGFGVNGNAFESLAKALPLRFLQKHSDSLFQLEAMMFGVAGFLGDNQLMHIPYYKRLSNEFAFLQNKFSLKVNDIKEWKFSGVRPSNFPHQRIAMLAALIHTSLPIFNKFIDATNDIALRKIFDVYPSDFWDTHYSFTAETPPMRKCLGKAAIDLIIINSVAPLLYAYSEYIGQDKFADRAISLLEGCKAENNSIVRKYTSAGIDCPTALASQAFIALNGNYCNPRNCVKCKIGYKLFKEEVKRSCK